MLQSVRAALAAALIGASGLVLGAEAVDPTPPRLSFVDGQASFWRPGAEDWAPARVNTPLAEGDALYTARGANIEVQVGPRAFVRAAQDTELGLVNLEPDFLQFRLTSGQASLDLRSVPPGHTVELDTPNAVFTIEQPGYYRAVVDGAVTHFITRRGGRAMVSVAGGATQTISASEELIVRGTEAPSLETYVAPQLDAWDQWNYARTDHEIEALSARYVSPGVYGVGALDYWGAWRVVPSYGPVWVPDRVAPGWAPYTAGSWMWDPHFGWTWVDDAPWGWAPFHHGRWVFIDGLWAWAPGPVIARPVYAPALVAFFGVGPSASVRIGIGAPAVSWVALAWGEPLRPWWGPPGFVGVPWWGGWGGPRVINNVVIQSTTPVIADRIVYHHTRVPRALAAVSEKQFGAGHVRATRFSLADPHDLQPMRDAPPVRPGPASLAPARGAAVRPPPAVSSRSVVTTRPPRTTTAPASGAAKAPAPRASTAPLPRAPTAPAPRVVPPPKRPQDGEALPRPSFGAKGAERPRPSQPPRLADVRRQPPRAAQPPAAQPAPRARALPGRPANEISPRSSQAGRARPQAPPSASGRQAPAKASRTAPATAR